jgi:hypothetical protein
MARIFMAAEMLVLCEPNATRLSCRRCLDSTNCTFPSATRQRWVAQWSARERLAAPGAS